MHFCSEAEACDCLVTFDASQPHVAGTAADGSTHVLMHGRQPNTCLLVRSRRMACLPCRASCTSAVLLVRRAALRQQEAGCSCTDTIFMWTGASHTPLQSQARLGAQTCS